jgi:hypothetical protein
MESREGMSDFTWYSRLLIWIGCAVLLAESIAGRPFGFATPMAVVMLVAGLLGFVSGLGLDARAPAITMGSGSAEVAVAPPAAEVSSEASTSVVETTAEPGLEGGGSIPEADTVVPAKPETLETPPARPTSRSQLGAISSDVATGGTLVGTLCLACQEPLRSGQVAATCGECAGVHHATCWVGNHFHCGRDGCSGHGRLEAPPEVSAEGH